MGAKEVPKVVPKVGVEAPNKEGVPTGAVVVAEVPNPEPNGLGVEDEPSVSVGAVPNGDEVVEGMANGFAGVVVAGAVDVVPNAPNGFGAEVPPNDNAGGAVPPNGDVVVVEPVVPKDGAAAVVDNEGKVVGVPPKPPKVAALGAPNVEAGAPNEGAVVPNPVNMISIT